MNYILQLHMYAVRHVRNQNILFQISSRDHNEIEFYDEWLSKNKILITQAV